MVGSFPISGGPLAAIAAALSGGVEIVLVLEDGTGVDGSNTWVLEADLDGYFLNQPRSLSAYTTEEKEGALVAAALILTYRFRWCGKRTTTLQELAWPRTGGYDQDRVLVDPDAIPEFLKVAQMELAYWLLENPTKTGFESDGGAISTNDYKEVEIFEGIRVEYKDSVKLKPLPDLILELVGPCGKLSGRGASFFIERS
jgi:hypothetical protein